jgi:hypothetical protein
MNMRLIFKIMGNWAGKYRSYLVSLMVISILLVCMISCHNGMASSEIENPLEIKLVEWSDTPVLKRGDPGTELNLFGFEGGSVIKRDGIYNLFTAEMVDTPWNVKMKLAHWVSTDQFNWKRVSTIVESSGNFTGTDVRAACWSPMPFYNEKQGRWNMFYVTYKSKPNNDTASFVNHAGRIWRSESQTPGIEGLGGPYSDVEVIMSPEVNGDTWEGLQGVDSYYVYQVNGKFYALYGSCNTQKLPVDSFRIGLATAPEMAGPWVRMSSENPLQIGDNFVENPIVTKLKDGNYIMIFDSGGKGIGYSFSPDGVNWSNRKLLILEDYMKKWWALLRTPMCLIEEEDGDDTIIFTAFEGGVVRDGVSGVG